MIDKSTNYIKHPVRKHNTHIILLSCSLWGSTRSGLALEGFPSSENIISNLLRQPFLSIAICLTTNLCYAQNKSVVGHKFHRKKVENVYEHPF